MDSNMLETLLSLLLDAVVILVVIYVCQCIQNLLKTTMETIDESSEDAKHATAGELNNLNEPTSIWDTEGSSKADVKNSDEITSICGTEGSSKADVKNSNKPTSVSDKENSAAINEDNPVFSEDINSEAYFVETASEEKQHNIEELKDLNERFSIWDYGDSSTAALTDSDPILIGETSTDANEDNPDKTGDHNLDEPSSILEDKSLNKDTIITLPISKDTPRSDDASVTKLISTPGLLTHKMAKVYEVNGSTYVDDERFGKHDDDTLARYELFKVVQVDGNDQGDDEDMTTELEMHIQTVAQGRIINNTVFLREAQWHTFAPVQDELSNCAVCCIYLHRSDFEEHIKSTSHLQHLNKYRPLSRFDLSIVRRINENLHCGVCNEIFDIIDYITHENSKTHEGNLLKAINKVSDLMYDSNVNLYEYNNRNSQNIDRNTQNINRNTQNIDRNYQSTDRNFMYTDRNRLNSDRNSRSTDRSSQSSERVIDNWSGFDLEQSWNINNPNLDRNIARLARNITSNDRNTIDRDFPSLDRNVSNIDRDFPCLDRNISIDRSFPSLDRNVTPDTDRNKKEFLFANAINNNNISVYEDYSDEEEYCYDGEEYNTPCQGVSYASMASKPSMETPKFLKIDLGTKEVRVKFESWNMLVKTDTNQFHCMVCNKREHIRFKSRHCRECDHVEKLAKCVVVRAFEDYLIRQVDDKFYHCGHCNNLQYQIHMIEHIESAHPKKNKNLIDDAAKTKKQSEKNKTDKSKEAKVKSESEKSAILNKSLELRIEKKMEPILVDIFGDVNLSPFGSELKISALSFNIILERDGAYYCAICDAVCEDVKAHVEDLDHIEQMNMTPFIRPFKSNLTRAVRGTLHCGLCNKLVQVGQIIEHNIDAPHINALAAALGMQKTQKPINNTKNHYNKTSDLNKTGSDLNKTSSDLNKTSSDLNKTSGALNKASDDSNKLGSHLNRPIGGSNTPTDLNKTIDELNKLSSSLNKTSGDLNNPSDLNNVAPKPQFTIQNTHPFNTQIKKDNGHVLKISECNSPTKTPPMHSPNNAKEKSTPKKLNPQNGHMPGQNGNPGQQNIGQVPLGQIPMYGQNLFPVPNMYPGQLPPQNIQYPYQLLKQNPNPYLGPPIHYNFNVPIAFAPPYNNNVGFFNPQNVQNNTTQKTEKSDPNLKNKPVTDTIESVNKTINSVKETVESVKKRAVSDKSVNETVESVKKKPVTDVIKSVNDNVQTDIENLEKSDEEDDKVFDEEESVFLKLKTTYFKITNLSYNTLVCSDGVRHYCFVCSSTVRISMLQKHVDNREHMDNLAKNKFLDKYGVQLFRQMYLMYHCAICNVLMTRKEIKLHLDWSEHIECYENSRKILNKKSRKELKSGVKEYLVETQKEAIFHNVNEPKINLISAYEIVPSLDSLKDTPETTPSKGSKPKAAKKNKMVILNNSVMKVSFDHWHAISKAKNVTKCILCQQELKLKEIFDHVESEYHCVALGKTFEKIYYPALIRKVNDMTVNCVICNLELANVDYMIQEHVSGRKHTKNQDTFVNESSNSECYADCYEDYLNL